MCIRSEGRAAPKPREFQAQPMRIQRAPEREAAVPTRQYPPPVQRRLEHPSA